MKVRNGSVSTIPADNNVHKNFIVANYAADGGCLDNDDGSSYYNIHHNFCVYGGHKSDFDGNSKVSRNNIHVYPSVYSSQSLSPCLALVLVPTCAAPAGGSDWCTFGGMFGKVHPLIKDGHPTSQAHAWCRAC